MQASTLKNPGDSPLAQTVRKELARLISNLEDAAVFGTPDAALAAFLADAASKTPGYAGPALPATSAIVADGGTVNVENSAGNLDSPGTAVVAANAITGVRLAATKTILTTAVAVTDVTITGTGTTFTPTVADGVLTGGVLS